MVFIYLAALGLICTMWDLFAASFVGMCELFVCDVLR